MSNKRKLNIGDWPPELQAFHHLTHLLCGINLTRDGSTLLKRARMSGCLSEDDLKDPALAQAIVFKAVRGLMVECGNRKKVEAFITRLDKFV